MPTRGPRGRGILVYENLVDEIEFVEASVVESELPTDVDVVFHPAALSSYAMHEEKEQLDGVYNLGTSEAYDFNTVVEMLNDELGTEIEAEYIENPIPDSVYVHDTCADYSKMKAETGWEPQISFAEGIEQMCRQYVRQYVSTVES